MTRICWKQPFTGVLEKQIENSASFIAKKNSGAGVNYMQYNFWSKATPHKTSDVTAFQLKNKKNIVTYTVTPIDRSIIWTVYNNTDLFYFFFFFCSWIPYTAFQIDKHLTQSGSFFFYFTLKTMYINEMEDNLHSPIYI